MAFTVQDDTGTVTGANAYVTEAEFIAYAADRAMDHSAYVTADIEAAIVIATDYLDQRFRFVGERLSGFEQATEWPRVSAYDNHRNYVNGVPVQVKEACIEYAFRALSAVLNPDPTFDATGATVKSKTEKVGPIAEETVYVDGRPISMPRYPAADKKLTRAGLTIRGGEVRRA